MSKAGTKETKIAKSILNHAKTISKLDLHLENTAVEEWYHMCLAIMSLYYTEDEIIKYINSENLSYKPILNKSISFNERIMIDALRISIDKLLIYNTIQKFSVFTPFIPIRDNSKLIKQNKEHKKILNNKIKDKEIFKANLGFNSDPLGDNIHTNTKSFSLLRGILGRFAEIGALSAQMGSLGSQSQRVENTDKRKFIIALAREIKANNRHIKSLRAIAINMRELKHSNRWKTAKFAILSEDRIYRILVKSEFKEEVRR